MSMASTPDGGYNLYGGLADDGTLWRNIGFDRTTGVTIETRIKVTSADPYTEGPWGAFAIAFTAADSDVDAALYIGSNKQGWFATSFGPEVDNTDDYHTYRIALDTNPDKGFETYTVWRDGYLLGTNLADTDWRGDLNRIILGDASSKCSGSVDIDYVRIGLGSWAPEALVGDANGDGTVDDADATILATNWQTATDATWAMGDFNGDGAVDDSDATLLASNWQMTAASQSAAVPEPSSLALLLSVLSLAAFCRRAR